MAEQATSRRETMALRAEPSPTRSAGTREAGRREEALIQLATALNDSPRRQALSQISKTLNTEAGKRAEEPGLKSGMGATFAASAGAGAAPAAPLTSIPPRAQPALPTSGSGGTLVQRKVTEDGLALSTDEIKAQLESRSTSQNLSATKAKKLVDERLKWADRLDEDGLSVDILALLNAKSYEALVDALKREAASLDEQVGPHSHAFARHSAVTKEEMAGRVGGMVPATTKLKSQEEYESFVLDFKKKAPHLKILLENMGADVNSLTPTAGNTPTNAQINQAVADYFGDGIESDDIMWDVNGAPNIQRRANGVIILTVAWKAETVRSYLKIKVHGADDSQYVREPIKIYGGPATVVTTVDFFMQTVDVGLGEELGFETAF